MIPISFNRYFFRKPITSIDLIFVQIPFLRLRYAGIFVQESPLPPYKGGFNCKHLEQLVIYFFINIGWLFTQLNPWFYLTVSFSFENGI